MCFNAIYDKSDLLRDGAVGRVEHKGIFRAVERGNVAVPILTVALLDLGSDLFERYVLSGRLILLLPTPGPLVEIGHHVDFYGGLREDDRTGVAPV
jgi:hypothetical protein